MELTMKHLIALVCCLLCLSAYVRAQQSEKTEKRNLWLSCGIKYAPHLGGAVLELSYYSPDKRLGINLRHDILLGIGKESYFLYRPDTTDILVQAAHYELTDYHTQEYLEVEYNLIRKNNYRLNAHLGYGWIYAGVGKNFRLNRDYGYGVISTAISYQPAWFTLELRGDIPVRSIDKIRHYWFFKASSVTPVSLALKYKFKPANALRKNNQ